MPPFAPLPDETRLRRKQFRDDILKTIRTPRELAKLAWVLLLWAGMLVPGAIILWCWLF